MISTNDDAYSPTLELQVVVLRVHFDYDGQHESFSLYIRVMCSLQVQRKRTQKLRVICSRATVGW